MSLERDYSVFAHKLCHLWEAGKLGLGQTDTDEMRFPAMSLEQAIKAFTQVAYGQELTFKHA